MESVEPRIRDGLAVEYGSGVCQRVELLALTAALQHIPGVAKLNLVTVSPFSKQCGIVGDCETGPHGQDFQRVTKTSKRLPVVPMQGYEGKGVELLMGQERGFKEVRGLMFFHGREEDPR